MTVYCQHVVYDILKIAMVLVTVCQSKTCSTAFSEVTMLFECICVGVRRVYDCQEVIGRRTADQSGSVCCRRSLSLAD